MATLDKRVAFLEGRAVEQARSSEGIRDALTHLEQRMDARFEAVDRRFDAIDRRFESVDGRLDGLDNRVFNQFVWLVGIQVTTLAAIVGALLTR